MALPGRRRWIAAPVIALTTALLAATAAAQYLYLDANANGIHDAGDRLGATTTMVDVYLDTQHNRDGGLATCGFGAGPLSLNSYEIVLRAVEGTVSWGPMYNFFLGTPGVIEAFAREPSELTGAEYYHNGTGSYFATAPGRYRICQLPITVVSGCPKIEVAYAYPGNGAAFTSFGGDCPADDEESHTYILGRNWFDWDGLDNAVPSAGVPTIVAPGTFSGAEGDAISFTVTATDPDGGDVLTISVVGLPASLTFATTPSPSPATGTVSGTFGYSDAGIYHPVWTVTDGPSCANSTTLVTTMDIANTDRAPVVSAAQSMDAPAGTMLAVKVSAADPDLEALLSLHADLSGLPPAGEVVFRIQDIQLTSGELTWTPTVNDTGATYSVKFIASNALTGSATTLIHVRAPDNPSGVESAAASPAPRLDPNAPNPFQPSTEIRFSLPRATRIRLRVFDLTGRRIATLADGASGAGEHAVRWTGEDDRGRRAASGVYYCRLEADGFVTSRRMVLLR